MSPDYCLEVFFGLKIRKYHQENLRLEIISLGKNNNNTNKQEIKGNELETTVKYYFQKICTTNVFSVPQKAMWYKKTWAQKAPG